jgi:hypothetical protein
MSASDSVPAIFVNGFELGAFEDGSVKLVLAEMGEEQASMRGCFALSLSGAIDLAYMLNVHIAEMELEDEATVVN